MTEERLEELDRAWNESDLMDDEEYREWYEDLTAEEKAVIDAWDKQYEKGVLRISKDILEHESRHPSVECQMAAAKAQSLLQRAAKLQNAEDLTRRLKDVERAARRPVRAEEEEAKGKDLANELNALEGDLRAREAQARKDREKSDQGLINAVGDMADGLTDHLHR